jgi:hypothetical protein
MAAPFRFGSVQAALSGIDDGQLLNFEHIAANNGDKRAVLAHALLVRRAQQVCSPWRRFLTLEGWFSGS